MPKNKNGSPALVAESVIDDSHVDYEIPVFDPTSDTEVIPARPGSSGSTLTQAKLRAFYELQQQFFDLRDRYTAEYITLQHLLITGPEIPAGSYKVVTQTRFVRRPRYKQVVIDKLGEQYQKRVLEQTPAHAHLRVKIQ